MTDATRQFAAIGEAMIELSHQSERELTMSFAGDTLNVTTYLARYARFAGVSVNYTTALGFDPYSNMMLEQWRKEGIKTQMVAQLTGKLPGLYLIRTNTSGERSFYFYRSESAARHLFKGDHVEKMAERLITMDYLYFSLITLAILDDTSRRRFFLILEQAKKNGATIIFDSNYRPALWPDLKIAQTVYQTIAKWVDIALPTFDDEQKLFNETTIEDCVTRLRGWGIKEIVIKRGEAPCFIAAQNAYLEVPAEKAAKIIDTTSAGDSFNAGYLAARMQNYTPAQAAACGHRLASVVIAHKGAIIPSDKMPVLF